MTFGDTSGTQNRSIDSPAPCPSAPTKPPPEPPQPAPLPRWTIHKAAHRLIWVGEVEAADEAAAIAKAAEQLGLLPAKLIATRRG